MMMIMMMMVVVPETNRQSVGHPILQLLGGLRSGPPLVLKHHIGVVRGGGKGLLQEECRHDASQQLCRRRNGIEKASSSYKMLAGETA